MSSGLLNFAHGISPAWIALAAGLACILPFSGVMSKATLNSKINFGLLFYVAGVLGVGAVVANVGLGEIIGKKLIDIIGLHPGSEKYNFFSLALLYTLVGTITTAPGIPAVITPLASDIASATGFPLNAVVMTQVIGFSNVILPYQVPPIVVAMQMGRVEASQGALFTIVLTITSLVILVPLNYFWWKLIGVFV